MSEEEQERWVRISDRFDQYDVVDVDTGELLSDRVVGFVYEDDAVEWAERQGWRVLG